MCAVPGRSTRSLGINAAMAYTAKILICVAAAMIVSGPAIAACPNGYPKVQAELAETPIVVIGKVLKESPAAPPWRGMYEGTRYTFRVAEVLKGKPSKTLSLFSENSTGRFPMEVGGNYFLFVYVAEHKGRRFFAVSNCGNSGKLPEAAPALETTRKLISENR
jgi:hypothetical protein